MATIDESAPLGERFHIDRVVLGLASDLDALRAGKISVDDARVRAEMAKQIMNGVRLLLNARKSLEAEAKLIAAVQEGDRS